MEEAKEIEMFVAGLVLDPGTNAPIVILKDETGEICLPIWIGLAEATAIASSLKKIELARPMTHDLLKTVVEELGATVIRVIISDLQENTFISSIEFRSGDVVRVIDARPSDAIALAVRVGAPVFVAEHVLDKAQVAIVPSEGGEVNVEDEDSDTNFANIDKEKWAEILEEMDPEDFKYKM